jgi:hypothetical protein
VNVFISHSTKTIPEHRAFLLALAGRLRREDFEVFVDADNVTAGAHWREVIFGRLADCNAAVILVNEPALSLSDWVDTEARIVCWRAWVERKNFCVIIVPIGGVTRTRITEHKPWQPLALAEVQMPATDTLDIANAAAVAEMFEHIIATLRAMPDQETFGVGESWIVHTLGGFLPPKPADVTRVAAALGIPRNGPEVVLRRSIVKWMYETGPAALRAFLDAVVRPVPRRDREFLLELLSTHWVDPRASTSILRYCGRTATDQIFAINGAEQWFTPQAYVQQLRRSSIVWPVIQIDQKRPAEEIVSDIRAELRKTYEKSLAKLIKRPERAPDTDLDRHLNTLLEIDAQCDEFVFVALPAAAANDASLIKAIHNTWRWIRIIVCTGTEAGGSPLPAMPMIEPELDIDLERQESRSYLAALRHTT